MPSSQKIFRVFVSSTFSDMRIERRILHELVFPKLKELCESNGATFQAVDLRWGVSENTQLDQGTMDLCLNEIARCQDLTPRPNFILLLGDRYGWQPVPVRIPADEMNMFWSTASDEFRVVLDSWYQQDLNAISREYILQPRTGDYCSDEKWQEIGSHIQSNLLEIIDKYNLPFTSSQKIKYFASATHQEIIRGALNFPSDSYSAQEHVFAYFRTIRNLPENEVAKDYLDLDNKNLDNMIPSQFSKNQLTLLKNEVKDQLAPSHVYDYQGAWDGEENNQLEKFFLDDPDAFAEQVYADLGRVIKAELDLIAEKTSLEREIESHKKLKTQFIKHFTGQGDPLSKISSYLSIPADKPLGIIGQSGCGKTSLLARAIHDADSQIYTVIYRFIGTTMSSSSLSQLLLSLIDEISSAYGKDKTSLINDGEDESIFSSESGFKRLFLRSLELAGTGKPLFVFLDALDQLSLEQNTIFIGWIPEKLPPNVHMVVTALDDYCDELKRHADVFELSRMSVEDGTALLNKWLSSINRTIQPSQLKMVHECFEKNGSPLYLKLVFEHIKGWRSYSTETIFPNDTDGMLKEFFDALEKKHGSLLVSKVCSYMLCGRFQGLSESELLELLTFDEEYWKHFLEMESHPSHRDEVEALGELPVIVWSRLFLDLEPYLSERESGGCTIISFFHRSFIDYVLNRYCHEKLKYHNSLADFFKSKPLYLDVNEHIPNKRKVFEQPYQQILSEQWNALIDSSLADFEFLMAKTKAEMLDDIQSDYRFVLSLEYSEVKDKLKKWESFFRERVHILRRGNNEWPAYKILLQLAIEHADDSPLTTSAEKFLADNKCDWAWLRRELRTENASVSNCLAVFEGHRGCVKGAILLSGNRLLTCAWDDETLRLWDLETGEHLKGLEGHTASVNGVLLLQDNRVLSWSDDNTLRLWDLESDKCSQVLEKHIDEVNGVLLLPVFRALSWGWNDGTLRLWDIEKGEYLKGLEGHTDAVNGVLLLPDNRALSWSRDNTLRLWDLETGKCSQVMEGHTASVDGVLLLQDNRVLSWSRDNTLRLWDLENEKFSQLLVGHTASVEGALLLQDNRALSWSTDTNIRLWDLKSGKCLEENRITDAKIHGLILLPDYRILIWFDTKLYIATINDLTSFEILKGHSDVITNVILLPDGRVLSWSDDNTFRLWNLENQQSCIVMNEHSARVNGVHLFPDGRVLSWSDDNTLRLWELNSFSIYQGLIKHSKPASGIHILTNNRVLSWCSGKYLFRSYYSESCERSSSGSKDGRLFLWDLETGKCLLPPLEGHKGGVNGVHLLPDDRVLTWSLDGSIRLWDLENRMCVKVLDGHTQSVSGVHLLPDNRILSWSDDETLRLWDLDNQKCLNVMKTLSINGVHLLPDNRALSWSADGRICLWDLESGKCVHVVDGGLDVNGILLLPDNLALSWDAVGSIQLWDLGKMLCVQALDGHTESVSGVHLLPDNRALSWSDDDTLRLWDLENGNCLKILDLHAALVSGVHPLTDNSELSSARGNRVRLGDLLRGKRFFSKGGIKDVSLLSNNLLLSRSEDGSILLWNIENCSYEKIIDLKKLISAQNVVWQALFGQDRFNTISGVYEKGNILVLAYINKVDVNCIYWHGSSNCYASKLLNDSYVINTLENGEVCILKTYIGNKQYLPITNTLFEQKVG